MLPSPSRSSLSLSLSLSLAIGRSHPLPPLSYLSLLRFCAPGRPDVAKFCHFGYFCTLGNFFTIKAAIRIRNSNWGNFLNRPFTWILLSKEFRQIYHSANFSTIFVGNWNFYALFHLFGHLFGRKQVAYNAKMATILGHVLQNVCKILSHTALRKLCF